MNRRGFLGALLATPAVPYVPALPVAAPIVAAPVYGKSIVTSIIEPILEQKYRWNDEMAPYWRNALSGAMGGSDRGGKL